AGQRRGLARPQGHAAPAVSAPAPTPRRGAPAAGPSAALAALALAACAGGQDPAPVCTLEARSSFAVTVQDSVPGEPLGAGATVVVAEGAFVDTLSAPAPGSPVHSGEVYERPGVYSVTITHPEYRPWRRDGVRVESDECHVRTLALTARLQAR